MQICAAQYWTVSAAAPKTIAGSSGLDPKMLEAIVLERFVEAIPARTSAWVRYYGPTDVKSAVKLAEEHLAVQREMATKKAEGPTPGPRRRLAPRWGGLEGEPPQRRPRQPEPPGASEQVPHMDIKKEHTPTRTQRHTTRGGTRGDNNSTICAFQDTGAAGRGLPSQMAPETPGPVCWRCGQPGHVRRECSMMEVGQVMRVVGPPAHAPDLGETYCVPVRVQGGIYRAMVDSGCKQSMVHQNLVRPGALKRATRVKIRCIHGDVHEYPIVPVQILYEGQKHKVKVAVSVHLTHPVILGTNWPGFNHLVTQCMGVRSRAVGEGASRTVFSGDAASSGTAERELMGASREAPPAPRWQPTEEFPLEQSRDETLREAWDQVDYIDGQLVRPGKARVFPHFSIIRDRLYRVSRDTQTGEERTQLLVPKRRREMVFQAAHFNPMSGHLGYDKTLNRVMVRFYWPGLRADVRRWCAACSDCQLVNPAATPKAPLRPLPLMEVPFERIGMDLIGPFHPSTRGYRFVLVLVDYATRYPEAVPLRSISAKSVAQALFQVISRVGIPKEILTDQGTSFMSRTIKELYGLLELKRSAPAYTIRKRMGWWRD
ncbi:uncharacterized protein LOC133659350 [Entelurus aequoreus]|uniref:uncharacterized protein LOC133659350 n=1 Tax=Entelurus aequoreus TaxID=161455 RepID=UPI002B1DD24D|nr:uncharacterized protein LOC133659350 [Entelurus aequoreus]XP_061918091.1 uncharacterized protein LOC133659350 [Entelurus aequoreus]